MNIYIYILIISYKHIYTYIALIQVETGVLIADTLLSLVGKTVCSMMPGLRYLVCNDVTLCEMM
jgi:hypothetical protein